MQLQSKGLLTFRWPLHPDPMYSLCPQHLWAQAVHHPCFRPQVRHAAVQAARLINFLLDCTTLLPRLLLRRLPHIHRKVRYVEWIRWTLIWPLHLKQMPTLRDGKTVVVPSPHLRRRVLSKVSTAHAGAPVAAALVLPATHRISAARGCPRRLTVRLGLLGACNWLGHRCLNLRPFMCQ